MTPTLRRAVRLLKWAVVGVVLLIGLLFGLCYLMFTTRVMTRVSPNRHHTARLYRVDGIDVNFSIYVDWRQVYTSPDFAAFGKDHRERVLWTEDSRWLIFEVADRKLFGYDVESRRELTSAEIESAKFTPFEELGYEGD